MCATCVSTRPVYGWSTKASSVTRPMQKKPRASWGLPLTREVCLAKPRTLSSFVSTTWTQSWRGSAGKARQGPGVAKPAEVRRWSRAAHTVISKTYPTTVVSEGGTTYDRLTRTRNCRMTCTLTFSWRVRDSERRSGPRGSSDNHPLTCFVHACSPYQLLAESVIPLPLGSYPRAPGFDRKRQAHAPSMLAPHA